MKRGTALSLLLIMLISSNVVNASTSTTTENQDSSATYYEQAVKLEKVNVLKGSSIGYELDRQPTRIEGLVMLIRLLGKEAEINAYKNEVSQFSDVPEWGKGYVNYAYKMGLTKGLTVDKFGSDDKITASAYMTFMLRALGYDDMNGDFVWSASLDKAKEISLIDASLHNELLSKNFTRNQVTAITYNTLLTNIKNNNKTLAEMLVDKGSIDKQTAFDIGIIIDDYTYLMSHFSSVVTDGALGEPFSLEDSEMILFVIYEKQNDIDKFFGLLEAEQKKLLNDIVVKKLGAQVANKTIHVKVILNSDLYATMDFPKGQDYLKSDIKILPNGEKTIVITQFINKLGKDEFTYYYQHSFPKLKPGDSKLVFKTATIGSTISDVEKSNLDIYQIEKTDKQLWYIETINKTDMYLIYNFENSKLTGVDYHIAESLNKDNCFATFNVFKEIIDKEVGNTGVIGQIWNDKQYMNDVSSWNTAIGLGQMYYHSKWTLGDVELSLVLMSLGDGEIDMMVSYRPISK